MNVGTAELGWRPEEFGFGRALLLACLPVVSGVVLLASQLSGLAVPPPPVMVQLVEPTASASIALASTQTTEPELATTAPPEPRPAMAIPANAPPPMLAEASASAPLLPAPMLPEQEQPALADLAEAPSDIPVPPKTARPPPRPAPMRPRPMHRASPASNEATETPAAVARSAQVLAPAASLMHAAPVPQEDTSSGIGSYRAELHAQIERNVLADESVRRLGVGGVATIEAVIAPDGRVLSAAVARSSGNRTIDRAAIAAVQRDGYRAFGPHMPPGPITISVPITVDD